jgi:hypothetical protein
MTNRDENASIDRFAGPGLMPSGIDTLLNTTGRVDPLLLARLAETRSVADFVRFLRRPVLAGSAIQAGSLQQRQDRNRAINQTCVFALDGQEESQDSTPEALKRAIYPLIKRADSPGASNILTIGRISDNDLVIPDIAISKHHAIIEIGQDGSSIRDRGSTNGTLVNSLPVGQKPLGLQDGDIIAFARYEFVFLTPESLYERLTLTASSPPE